MWPCGLMDKALVFGTKDCRFESCQGQEQCQKRAASAIALGAEKGQRQEGGAGLEPARVSLVGSNVRRIVRPPPPPPRREGPAPRERSSTRTRAREPRRIKRPTHCPPAPAPLRHRP